MTQYRIIKKYNEYRVQSRHFGFWITRSVGASEYWARNALSLIRSVDLESAEKMKAKWEVVPLETHDE